MLMKKLLIPIACIAALVACDKVNPGDIPGGEIPEALNIKITPVITKVSETSFDKDDAIGVNIVKEEGVVYKENAQFIYDGANFTSDVKWYTELDKKAAITAYYPYAASGVPASFSVSPDQAAGLSASDFVAGSISGVTPTLEPVVIPFKHKLSLVTFNIDNKSGQRIGEVLISDVAISGTIDANFDVAAPAGAQTVSVKPFAKSVDSYVVILPPQTATILPVIKLGDGTVVAEKLAEATLEGGKKYTVNVVIDAAEEISVSLAADIENWNDGGELAWDTTPEEVQFEENLDRGVFVYDQVTYRVVKLDDGKWWMAQNLAFVPKGFTPSSDLTKVTAGVFYPLKVNEAKSAAEFDLNGVASKGYLYQAEVALGLKVGDLKTVDAAQKLEGAQGICPPDWHVPTSADILALVGKSVGLTTNADAPYYDGANGSIVLLNQDGFNMDAFGAISIQDNTKTAGTFMGFSSSYPDKLSSGMFCGSSYAGVTYNTSGDETSGVKNLQFHGFMPMTNKATEAEYTCNGSKVSYRIAAPVRCVRDGE